MVVPEDSSRGRRRATEFLTDDESARLSYPHGTAAVGATPSEEDDRWELIAEAAKEGR